jgi:hypothetical protein
MGVRRSVHEKVEDPRLLLVQLVAACQAAGRRLGRSPLDEATAAVLRRCALELALLVEACGASLPSAVSVDDEGALDVLGSYRSALDAPMPRAVQAVLRDHVARLEQCFAPPRPRVRARPALGAGRPLGGGRSLAA